MDEQQEGLLDLNQVMHAFGIDEWQNLGPVEPHISNTFNLRVDVAGEHYILKERPEGLINEDPMYRYHFQQFLQQQGIPIPSLRLTPQGEPMVATGEDYFELHHEANGERFSTADPHNLQWVAAAGTMSGNIHQASRRYTGPIHRWPSEAHIGGMVQSYLNMARARAETSEIEAIGLALSEWCDAWEQVLPSAMVSIGAVRGLPEFHIHGDYHALNLRFGRDDVTAVIGWEASRQEKRIIELAYALFYFSALEWWADSPFTRPLVQRGLDPELARIFLRAYGAIYPPVAGEAAILGDALTLVAPIATINGPLEDIFFTQQSMEEVLIEDVLERIEWATSLPTWLQRVKRSLAEMWR